MSIERAPSGKYKVRYRDGGKSRSRSFDLRRDAEAFDQQVRGTPDQRPYPCESRSGHGQGVHGAILGFP
jgi:hypothetical protein